jgi:tripartite-type tricarboxylate transporter receptor subunit TctC
MMKRLLLPALICTVLGAAPLMAQEFPVKPVKVVIPYAAGSGPDTVMRLLGDKLARSWGQQLVVDNRPGGNGWLAIDAAKKAPADGYTLLDVDDSQMVLQPLLYKKLPHDMAKDFEPVGAVFRTNFFVVVSADSPWKTLPDLIASAKANPGKLTYGSPGIGTVPHVGAAMLAAATGTQMQHAPFKDVQQLFGSVANGDIAWALGTAGTSGSLYRAKKVRFLALAAPQRLAGYTDIPTVSEAGGPAGFEVQSWGGMYAPHGTPKAIIDRLNADLNRVLVDPEVRAKLGGIGFVTTPSTPEAMAQAIVEQSERFAPVIKAANISLD